MEDKKGTATNRDGLGSTYAGTQTPDPQAPDGYQKPSAGAAEHGSSKDDEKDEQALGREYDSKSSYGDKDSKQDETGGVDDQPGNGEEGSPIR